MKMEKWSFSNGTETRVISAIDGPTAWKELAKVVGVKMWHGGFEIPLPHAWNINCVCDCGKAQATKYCSKACYENFKMSVDLSALFHEMDDDQK